MNLTAKQEKFCQAIVAGNSQSEAYRTAYDAENMAPQTVNHKASRLMAKGHIGARVAELRAPVVENLQYDLRAAMGEANEALEMAKAQGNTSVMVQATALRAKLCGLLIDKPTVVQSVLETTATEILLAMLADHERRIAARQLEHAHHAEPEPLAVEKGAVQKESNAGWATGWRA